MSAFDAFGPSTVLWIQKAAANLWSTDAEMASSHAVTEIAVGSFSADDRGTQNGEPTGPLTFCPPRFA
jgi:hypothetical protein